MNPSISLGQWFGIHVRIHWTFSLLLAWAFFSRMAAGQSVPEALVTVAFVVVLFGCVLLHEFGHALTAARFGVQTRDIVLLPIGGVARMERMPEKPMHEFLVAIAGPMVNVAIASLLAGTLMLTRPADVVSSPEFLTQSFAGRVILVNFMLFIFNMVPAFPMDGGRVLRALLATRMDYVRATDIAAQIGQTIAIFFGFIGFLGNPMLIFIAIFVYFGAGMEAAQVRMKTLMSAVPVSAVMIRDFRSLQADDDLKTAVDALLSGDQQDFPVVAEGRLVGVLTRSDLLKAIEAGKLNIPVEAAMHTDCPVAQDTDRLEDVVTAMNEKHCSTTPVTHDGRLIGVINLENINEWLAIQSALRRHAVSSTLPDAMHTAQQQNTTAT